LNNSPIIENFPELGSSNNLLLLDKDAEGATGTHAPPIKDNTLTFPVGIHSNLPNQVNEWLSSEAELIFQRKNQNQEFLTKHLSDNYVPIWQVNNGESSSTTLVAKNLLFFGKYSSQDVQF
jgi:hypothetical protein